MLVFCNGFVEAFGFELAVGDFLVGVLSFETGNGCGSSLLGKAQGMVVFKF